jgi:hypothetical protein
MFAIKEGGGVLLGESAHCGEEGVAEHAADDDAFEPGVEGGPVRGASGVTGG